MTKVPREEISYKEIYKNLDIERKHKINLPKEDKVLEEDKEDPKARKMSILEVDTGVISMNDVHYCLDDYDNKFIELIDLNISPETLEFVIDRLEKQWFYLLQTKIQSDFVRVSPDKACDICSFEEYEDNLMLICQCCGISIHRDCYGSSYDKEEIFICTGCKYYDKNPQCMFCPSKGGVLKMTSDCRWGHLTCVLFNETLDFDNPNSREPIDLSKYIEYEGFCMFCNDLYGTKIQCSYGVCQNYYHVSCALDKVYFDMANNVSYCSTHNPLKPRNLFSNSSIFLKDVCGYKKLSNKPEIRKKLPLTPRKATILSTIIKTKPFITVNFYNNLKSSEPLRGQADILETLCLYWKHKKEKHASFLEPFLRFKFMDF